MCSGIDRGRNLADVSGLIAQAAAAGATFVVTPEMTDCVDRNRERMLAGLPGAQDAVRHLAALAAQHGIWLLAGSVAVPDGRGRAFNRSHLFSPDGAVVAHYDKLHLFDVSLPDGETWRESDTYRAGSDAVLARMPFCRAGMTICYDLRFPLLYRRLAQAGADVVCIPAAFTAQTGRAHWKTLLTARAIENGAFIIAPAQGGLHEDGRETFGHSMIAGPCGDVLACADGTDPCIITADIDIEQVRRARACIPATGSDRRYGISVTEV